MAADGHGGKTGITARPACEDVTDRIHFDRAALLPYPGDEEVAHLLVLGRQCQPPQTRVAEPADLGGTVDGGPQPEGVDLEVVLGVHAALHDPSVQGLAML